MGEAALRDGEVTLLAAVALLVDGPPAPEAIRRQV